MKPIKNRSVAVSEIVSSVLLVGITIVGGLAVFSFVNQQASISAQQYGNTVGNSIATLGEQFVVVDLNFTASGKNVSIWVYNNGQTNLQIVQVLVYNSTRAMYIRHNATHITDLNDPSACTRTATLGMQSPNLSAVDITAGSMQKITLSLPCPSGMQSFYAGTTYFVNILSKQGNVVIYNRQR